MMKRGGISFHPKPLLELLLLIMTFEAN